MGRGSGGRGKFGREAWRGGDGGGRFDGRFGEGGGKCKEVDFGESGDKGGGDRKGSGERNWVIGESLRWGRLGEGKGEGGVGERVGSM